DIVEVRGILIPKEQADVPVRVVARRALHLCVEDEVADGEVLDEGDVERAAVRRLVLALRELAVGLAVLDVNYLPGVRVGGLPGGDSLRVVVLEQQRQLRAVGGPGKTCPEEKESGQQYEQERPLHDILSL